MTARPKLFVFCWSNWIIDESFQQFETWTEYVTLNKDTDLNIFINLIYSLWSDSLHENMTFNNNTVCFFSPTGNIKDNLLSAMNQSTVKTQVTYTEICAKLFWSSTSSLCSITIMISIDGSLLKAQVTKCFTPSTDYKMICGILSNGDF